MVFKIMILCAVVIGLPMGAVAQQAPTTESEAAKAPKKAERDSIWQEIKTNGIPALRVEKKGLKASLNAYLDMYYRWDSGEPKKKDIPYFYSSQRHNEFMVNMAMLDARLSYADRVRTRIALGYGSYFVARYAHEPAGLRMIYEASAGVRLAKGIWVDGGVLEAPYGYEKPISMQQANYTRSLSAEASPYYLTGVKFGFSFKNNVTLNAFVVNGWQTIASLTGTPAVATQLQYKPAKDVLLNWSTYVGAGTDGPRVYNNLYAAWTSKKLTLVGLMDLGIEKADYNEVPVWFTTNFCFKYRFTNTVALGGRGEFFVDNHSIIISSVNYGDGVTVGGGSVNLDISPLPNALIRFECRALGAKDEVFLAPEGRYRNWSISAATSLGVQF